MSAGKLRRGVLIGLLAFSAEASTARAGLSFYVQIPTIGGESTAQNHEGWIEASAFAAQVSNPVIIGPGGTQTGVPNLSAVDVFKQLDKASPKLAKAVATGTTIGNVILDMVDSASGQGVYHIFLRNAYVETDQVSGASELPTEIISIPFGAIEWTYTFNDQQGSSQFMAYWDRINVVGGPGPLPTPTPAAQTDTDGDGMPDSYEMANGLNPLVPDALGDLDGDGSSNISEYLAGTRANDPNSVFRVHGLSQGNGTILITWNSVGDRTYSIRSAPTPNGPWTVVQSGIPGFEGVTSRNVPMTNLFFQVTIP
jgi:type VI secretion system Hcp family effector